ncbi:MAG: hypothetical protein ACE37F_30450 [Nannocystaceae bacterium]|nr:hypothetical protein [bacterium]
MSDAKLPADFADLLECLIESGADYMLIGGYAVMAHGYIRATQDLDVWVRPTAANAARVMAALREFGLPPGLSEEDLLLSAASPPTGFRFGRPPFAVDMITSVRGVEFEVAWAGSTVRRFGGLDVRVIGRAALLANKRATGRAKDAADVEALEALADFEPG